MKRSLVCSFHYCESRAIVDGLVIKVRGNGRVINKSLYFALAVNMEGYKELLGMWISRLGGCKVLAIGTH